MAYRLSQDDAPRFALDRLPLTQDELDVIFMSAGVGSSVAPPTPPTSAPFAKINGPLDGPSAGPYEGWSADTAVQVTVLANAPFTVRRQGYTSAGAVTSYDDIFYVVKTTSAGGAVRQPFPNQALQSALTVALSDYAYSTDAIFGGAVNNSTFISPIPIFNWMTPDRRLCGNTIGGAVVPVEVNGTHRNARNGLEVACVIFHISDGVTTINVTVTVPTVSTYPGDPVPISAYVLPATDITALSAGTITVDASVYPWIGAAASVSHSAAGTRREFTTRYFQKNVAKFAAPDIMYVSDSIGVDATAQVNSLVLPAKTIIGAINRMRTGSAGAPWSTATTRIRILDAGAGIVASGTASGSSVGEVAGLIIDRDPGITRAAALIVFGLATFFPTISLPATPAFPALIFLDVSLNRAGGASSPWRTPSLEVQTDQVNLDNSTLTTNWFSNSSSGQGLRMYGTICTNGGAGGAWNALATCQQQSWRGVTMTTPGTTEVFCHFGCLLTLNGSTFTTASGLTHDKAVFMFNKYLKITNTSFFSVSTTIATGFALSTNVFEYCSATAGLSFGMANDGLTNSNTNVMVHNNTFVGFFSNGRCNLFYDEGATPRTSKLQSVTGLFTQINTKSDIVVASGARIGNWGFMYGAGCQGNWSQYIDANSGGLGTSFAQAYPGIGSSIGTSNAIPQMATANFTNYQATTAGPTVGAGGGTYSGALASVKATVPVGVANFDLAGVARPATLATAGAYEAP